MESKLCSNFFQAVHMILQWFDLLLAVTFQCWFYDKCGCTFQFLYTIFLTFAGLRVEK